MAITWGEEGLELFGRKFSLHIHPVPFPNETLNMSEKCFHLNRAWKKNTDFALQKCAVQPFLYQTQLFVLLQRINSNLLRCLFSYTFEVSQVWFLKSGQMKLWLSLSFNSIHLETIKLQHASQSGEVFFTCSHKMFPKMNKHICIISAKGNCFNFFTSPICTLHITRKFQSIQHHEPC